MDEMSQTGQSHSSHAQHEEGENSAQRWRPLSAYQRRVVGVLIEKARTTPDVYPMTLNGLTNGCNQKSNRAPQYNLSADQVETVLDELREMGVVAEVQTGGRVAKYRHYAYEWLGVDKREIAVMAELLLRGEQTLGDLRARASRMEPIADQQELKTIVSELLDRGLMLEITPPGRGQIVSHALYTEREREKMNAHQGSRETVGRSGDPAPAPGPRPRPQTPAHLDVDPSRTESATEPPGDEESSSQSDAIVELQDTVEELKLQVEDLTERLARLESMIG